MKNSIDFAIDPNVKIVKTSHDGCVVMSEEKGEYTVIFNEQENVRFEFYRGSNPFLAEREFTKVGLWLDGKIEG